jgi:hypothetical protein
MTNRELMMLILKGEADDDGASFESMANYNIACPYNEGDKRAECYGKETEINDDLFGICTKCKMKWLESEVDE